jgi:hypothetical protein
MTDPALRRALWAVARVAGAATLLGCAPGTLGVHIPDAAPTISDDVPEPIPEPEATCDQLIVDIGEAMMAGEDVMAADDATLDCCEDLIADIDETGEWPTEQAVQHGMQACCQALGWPGGLACTPWGPPAPPAMRALA